MSPARTCFFLPALNALLNGLAAMCAMRRGLACILRAKRIAAHRAAMFTAFLFSTLFLVSYITNHALHGDMHFTARARSGRSIFTLLISHIGLSMIALPLILMTFFLFRSAAAFPSHKKLARWTFPIWLYVSVTGVIVYDARGVSLSRLFYKKIRLNAGSLGLRTRGFFPIASWSRFFLKTFWGFVPAGAQPRWSRPQNP